MLVLLRFKWCISNLYILDQHSRLPYHTICVTHLGYISLSSRMWLFSLTLKTRGCWNMLESSLDRIPLIGLSQILARILFIISNSKLGIWICSQSTIYLNSQSNFYDVLTLYHTILFPETNILLSPFNLKTSYSEHILHLVTSSHN